MAATSPETCASVNCLLCCAMMARAASRSKAGASPRRAASGSRPLPEGEEGGQRQRTEACGSGHGAMAEGGAHDSCARTEAAARTHSEAALCHRSHGTPWGGGAVSAECAGGMSERSASAKRFRLTIQPVVRPTQSVNPLRQPPLAPRLSDPTRSPAYSPALISYAAPGTTERRLGPRGPVA